MKGVYELKEALASFKKALIILGIFLVLFVSVKVIIPVVSNKSTEKSPVISIEAENETEYTGTQTISPEDFTVYEVHENGGKTELDTEEYEISQTTVNPVGKTTTITVSLVEDPDLKCSVDVQVEREKIFGFHCGYPNESDVIAVLYSNGELCFEGEGDVLQFDEGEFPWQDYDGMDDYPVTAVSFEKGVTPTSMDNWFSNMETLTYIDEIPASVRSMSYTCSGCTALTEGPDWSNCTELLNIMSVCEDCISLTSAAAIPASVRNAVAAFAGCLEMQTSPDLSGAESLVNAESMFEECKKLTAISMPPNVENISYMFAGCINLKEMPQIPDTTQYMEGTFENNISLMKLSPIPAGVKDVTKCLENCGLIEGTFTIDADPEEYGSFLLDTAVATKVDLTGESKLLNELALTTENGNITVNGKEPVEEK